MPVIYLDDAVQDLSTSGELEDYSKKIQDMPETTRGEVALKSFMDESSIVQSIKTWGREHEQSRYIKQKESGYYVWDKIPEEHQDSAEHYMGVYSEEDKIRVDRMLTERKLFQQKAAQYPITAIAASMAGGVFSYGSAIPLGMVFKGYKAGQSVKTVLKNAAAVGAVTAGSVGLDEAIIREGTGKTMDESLADMALAGAFGFGIGGILSGRIAAKVSKETRDGIVKGGVEADLSYPKLTDKELDEIIEERQAGGESIGGFNETTEKIAKAMVHPLKIGRGTTVEGLFSDSKVYNNYIENFMDHNLFTKKNMPGIDKPRGKVYAIELQRAHNELITPHISNTKKLRMEYEKSAGRDAIPFSEIEARATRVLMDETYIDELKVVNDVAESNRKLIREMGEKMQELGILGKDVDVKSPWLSNIYKKNLIVENKAKYIKAFADDFMENNPRITKAQAKKSAINAVDNILGTGDKYKEMDKTSSDAGIIGFTNAWSKGTGANFLKKRKVTTSQKKMLEWGILDTNITHNTIKYVDKALRMIKMKEQLDHMGIKGVDDIINKLNAEYNQRSLMVTGKKAQRLKREKDLAEIEIKRTFREHMGLPGVENAGALYNNEPARIWSEYLGYVLLTMMGLSSVVEAAWAILRTGPAKTFFDGWAAKLKDAKLNKASNEELAYLGYGVQHIQGEAIGRLIDGNSEYFGMDEVWGGMRGKMRQGFQNATGMSYMINAFQRVGAKATQAKIAHQLRKWKSTGKIDPKEKTYLNSLGINEIDYNGYLSQIETHGGGKKAPFYMGFRLWDDKVVSKVDGVPLKDKIQASVILSTNSIVNIAKVGDMQTWAVNSVYGRAIAQFTSYFSRAAHAIMLSGLQRRDKDVAYAVTTAILLGMMQEKIKQEINPRRKKLEGVDEWLIAGLQSSGATTIGMNQIMALLMIASAQREGGEGRWAADRVGGQFWGPSIWGIKNILEASAGLSDGELTDSEKVKLMRAFFPGYGLPYIKPIADVLAGVEDK